MSDFLLDLRPPHLRALRRAADRLRFTDDVCTGVIDHAAFGIVIAETGNKCIWSPYTAADGSIVVVAGRIVLDDHEWDAPLDDRGSGGRAARSVYAGFRDRGLGAVEHLNGNCAVVIHDAPRRHLHLITDICGAFPVFEASTGEGLVFGSHPDVVSDAANEQHQIDEASIAEFILCGTVSAPYSYYRRIRAADSATVFTFDLGVEGRPLPTRRRYFEFSYRGDSRTSKEELASELAAKLRRAVERRTSPRLGPTAVALSGGLDSRVVLACSQDKEHTFAFCCYDTPNRELNTAQAIAQSQTARFLPLQRSHEYYADWAEHGVRMSGGMGNFANNHFLGVMPRLKQEGMQSMLTGCYCDYLFKGLPLNKRIHPLTRRQQLAPYRHEFYFDHIASSTGLAAQVKERLEVRFPRDLRNQVTPEAVFELEARRTFPLCYEGDNQQRVVPQRMTGWCPPFIDRDLMELYCRLPYAMKLNRSVFRNAVAALGCGLSAVPDANTGARPDAPAALEWIRGRQLQAQRVWRRLTGTSVNDESWPDWRSYVRESPKLSQLWQRRNSDASDLFRRVLGDRAVDDVETIKRQQPFLFVGLLTIKLWLDQRAS